MPRETLIQLIRKDSNLVSDSRRLKGLLADSCTKSEDEPYVSAILSAQSKVVAQMNGSKGHESSDTLLPRLSKALSNTTGLREDIAEWSISVWAEALGIDSNWQSSQGNQTDVNDADAQYALGRRYYKGEGMKEDKAEAMKWYRKAAEQGHFAAQCYLGVGYSHGEGVQKDKIEAMKWYRKAAEQGSAVAQYFLGCGYDDGEGVKEDKTEAAKWYQKAAEQGDADAQFKIGYAYSNGEGVKEDKAEAMKWYRKAAEQGIASAQYNLGLGYDCGRGGLKEDKTEAAKWYRKAAEQGEANAQFNLGLCYANGEGVERDYAETVKWYRKAAEQGEANAQSNLGLCYANGKGVKQDDAEAVRWYRKAAEQGIAKAQFNLGVRYDQGKGVKEDDAEAVRWYRKAAEQGEANAQFNLGLCYANGEGVERDYAETVKWYRKAAEQGEANAQSNLGLCYANGKGVKQDDAEAVRWYRKAAEQGKASAQCYLGARYLEGKGVKEDKTEAVKWFRKAAEQGHAISQYYLGFRYFKGEGVGEDDAEAMKWFRKAAEQNDADAQFMLGRGYYSGIGNLKQDKVEAMKWFRKAAEQGEAAAQYYLGLGYLKGEGVWENTDEAMKWFRKAAKQGNADAIAYLNGKEVKKDNAEAKVTGKPKWGILSRIIKSIVVVVLGSICVAIGIVHDYYQNTEQKRNAVAAAEQLLIAPNEISRIKIARLPVKLVSETVNGNTNTHPVFSESADAGYMSIEYDHSVGDKERWMLKSMGTYDEKLEDGTLAICDNDGIFTNDDGILGQYSDGEFLPVNVELNTTTLDTVISILSSLPIEKAVKKSPAIISVQKSFCTPVESIKEDASDEDWEKFDKEMKTWMEQIQKIFKEDTIMQQCGFYACTEVPELKDWLEPICSSYLTIGSNKSEVFLLFGKEENDKRYLWVIVMSGDEVVSDEVQKRNEELNASFTDYFYTIPEETYQKLNLTTNKIFLKKPEVEVTLTPEVSTPSVNEPDEITQ